MWAQFALLSVLSVSSSFFSSCLPSINTYLSNMSHPLSIRHPPLCDADLWKLAWNGLYPPVIFLGFPPLPLLTSAQTGGALLNRLAVSRGITSHRRGLSGTAFRQTESPVSPTFSHNPVLLLSAAVRLAHDLAHTHPHAPWHGFTWIILTWTTNTFSVCVCVHALKHCLHTLTHIYMCKMSKLCTHMIHYRVQKAIVAFCYE